MKKLLLVIFIISFVTVNGQFKEDYNKKVDIKSGILSSTPNSSIFGFFNPQNFSMHHSVGMSYSSFGGNGIALGTYTNSMAYKISDKLNVEVDASLVNSPYSSFGREFSDQINGFYLSRAQINYKPAENWNLILQFRQVPGGYSPFGMYDYSSRGSNFLFEDTPWQK
ncbi:MAG: hypothetical protein K9J16_06630 [Melioribacteraceae bacterium]|nr:hypothetical protein [Melioribacteraceae bacterium]MCF8353092.1 hypothetical protein [Melioribacteraceae bacterium]MCF8392762.1 hypothetical protein [Melioribacteraceae bacterium]MCF8418293.1 hypothetical protein [Melioribacteraceae bacterium]